MTMLPDDYIRLAQNTKSSQFHPHSVPADVLHAAIGLSTEAGELLDAVKKSVFYGKRFDKVNCLEEMGDITWYLSLICNHYGITFERLMAQNIAKLAARFPDKFTTEKALVRDLAAERAILEAHADEDVGF